MHRYLVGGAVRDELLKLPVHDRDWVVVGATQVEMLAAGYQLRDEQFQIYLDAVGEEHALARVEQKAGDGHRGFKLDFSPSISLERDLERRDITINAMARDGDGAIIDPFDGLYDLELRRLRHVSEAFSEDPLRVLRVAKFHARLERFGFVIAPTTQALMKLMCNTGAMSALTPTKIWGEVADALLAQSPHVFFQTLHDCDALGAGWPLPIPKDVMPAWITSTARLVQIPTEIGARTVALCVLAVVCGSNVADDGVVNFPLTVCDKPTRRSAEVAFAILHYLREPQIRTQEESLLHLLESQGGLRKPERFLSALNIVATCCSGEPWEKHINWDTFSSLISELTKLDTRAIAEAQQKIDPRRIKEAIRIERLQVVARVLKSSPLRN
jgi:hypothetical protein